MYTREPMSLNIISLLWRIRDGIFTESDKNSFRLFNRNVRPQEPTFELQITSNFKEIMDQKSLVKEKKTAHPKKVIFNLDQHYEEYEEEE